MANSVRFFLITNRLMNDSHRNYCVGSKEDLFEKHKSDQRISGLPIIEFWIAPMKRTI